MVRRDDIFLNNGNRDVNRDLHDFQIVNHFSNNNLLTTKVGLCTSLKNLNLWQNDTMDSFFPKCFIISKSQGHASTPFENDIEQFNEEYRFVFSASILKKYINKAT